MSSQIVNIKTKDLVPHPNNPRKNLGDLTELAESIKTRGVLQNLTVVKGDADKANYTIIIGHRRHAAAQLAKVDELPCVISEMDDKEQVATMLLENIQRNDLTVYEQAQGFQMMLDLGETVNSISELSGFSETTVRRRVNLLELDHDKFLKSVEREASLTDYFELSKIKDIERRNQVLEHIGTSNFAYQLRSALDDEKKAEILAAAIERISEFAELLDERPDNRIYQGWHSTSDYEQIEKPEDADSVKYYFTADNYGIRMYRDRTEEDDLDDEEEEETPEERERREHEEKLEHITVVAYQLRMEFVKNYKPTKKHGPIIAAFAANRIMYDNGYYYDSQQRNKLLGIYEEMEDDEEFNLNEAIDTMIDENPERVLFVASYVKLRDSSHDSYYDNWFGKKDNFSLDAAYDILEQVGYKMSDDEKALRDGTHELFVPVDLCARCHWSRGKCDKDCCAVCEDGCNGRQRCRNPEKQAEREADEEGANDE